MNINIEANKQQVIRCLSEIARYGIQDLINWLVESDFFIAPASKKYHLAVPGGLAQHSLNVRQMVWNLFTMMNLWDEDSDIRELQGQSLDLVSLTHDICKVYMYVIGAEYPLTDAMAYSLRTDSAKFLYRACQEDRERFKVFCYDTEGKIKMDLSKDTASKLITWLKAECAGPMPETPVSYKIDEQFPVGHGCKSVFSLQKLKINLSDEEIAAINWHMGPWDLSEYVKGSYNQATVLYPLVTILQTADSIASKILEVDHESND